VTHKLISIVILTIIAILIGLLIWFSTLNFGSHKLNQTLVKIVGFLAAALIFVFLDIFNINNEFSSSVKVLMPRKGNNFIVGELNDKLRFNGSDHNKGYELMHRLIIFSKQHSDKQYNNENAIALDIMEITFWQWMSKNYHLHWQVDNEEFIGIQGGGSTGSKSKNASETTHFLSHEYMSEILSDNVLELSKGFFWGIHLPYKSQLTVVKRTESERTYIIKTRNLKTKITMRWVGNSGIEHSKLGDEILKDLPNGKWYSNHILVKFESKIDKRRIFSVETKKQSDWIKEMQQNFYNDFDWSLVKIDLEKAYLN
jgi:hypothetical protein